MLRSHLVERLRKTACTGTAKRVKRTKNAEKVAYWMHVYICHIDHIHNHASPLDTFAHRQELAV